MGLDDNVFHFLQEETLFARKELRELGAKICIAGVKKKKNQNKKPENTFHMQKEVPVESKGKKK